MDSRNSSGYIYIYIHIFIYLFIFIYIYIYIIIIKTVKGLWFRGYLHDDFVGDDSVVDGFEKLQREVVVFVKPCNTGVPRS